MYVHRQTQLSDQTCEAASVCKAGHRQGTDALALRQTNLKRLLLLLLLLIIKYLWILCTLRRHKTARSSAPKRPSNYSCKVNWRGLASCDTNWGLWCHVSSGLASRNVNQVSLWRPVHKVPSKVQITTRYINALPIRCARSCLHSKCNPFDTSRTVSCRIQHCTNQCNQWPCLLQSVPRVIQKGWNCHCWSAEIEAPTPG